MRYFEDVHTRQSTIRAEADRNALNSFFGRWINQFKRAEFADAIPSGQLLPKREKPQKQPKLSPKAKREAIDQARRLRAVGKKSPEKIQEPICTTPKPIVKTVCNHCNKRNYSKAGAQRALRVALGTAHAVTPKRMYFCDHSKKYHLSSKL